MFTASFGDGSLFTGVLPLGTKAAGHPAGVGNSTVKENNVYIRKRERNLSPQQSKRNKTQGKYFPARRDCSWVSASEPAARL